MSDYQEGITLKQSILTIKDYLKELIRKWYWYVIVIALFLVGTFFYLASSKPNYVATSTFMINSDEGGGMSAISQLAGQFGFGGGKNLKSEKVIELMGSRKMIYETLGRQVEIEGKKDYLFNHYLELIKKAPEGGFRFEDDSTATFDIRESSKAQAIYNKIRRNYLYAKDRNDNGIINANMTTPSEAFSKEFLENLLLIVSDYYIKRSVEQQKQTFDYIQLRVDSIASAMESAEYRLNAWYNDNIQSLKANATLRPVKMLESSKLERKIDMLAVMYEEALRNFEFAQMNLLSSTPVIQIIDAPAYPLEVSEKIPYIYYGFFTILAFSLVTLLIIVNKLIRDALNS